jgi:hypothetical protein
MIPVAEYLTQAEVDEYMNDPEEREGDDRLEQGWYARLSAPGYLDCTDWSGPYESERDALQAVMEEYEVDENGDEVAA